MGTKISIFTAFFLIFCTSNSFSADYLSPKEYYKEHYPDLIYHVVNPHTSIDSELIKKNCFYVISSIHDLKGEILTVPEGSVLYFISEDSGFKKGIVSLSNDCHVIGGTFSFSPGDVDYYLYPGSKMNTPLLIEDVSNVIIEQCHFNYITDEDRPAPSLVVYGNEKQCNNIIIRDNTFNVSGVGFFCDVKNSIIENNIFSNIVRALRIETLYDRKPYRSPDNITIKNNTITGQDRALSRPLIWISGVRRVFFMNNNVNSSTDELFLYCGDGNIALDTIIVSGNSFTLRESTIVKNIYKHCISVRGKSYPYQQKGTTLGSNVIIKNNSFLSEEPCALTHSKHYRAIAVNFVKDISVNNNSSINFSSFISFSDDFKDLYERCTNVSICGNIIRSTYENAFRFSTDINSCYIDGNNIEFCNESSGYHLDLQKLSDMQITNNKIVIPKSYNKRVIKTKLSVGVKRSGNSVLCKNP